MRKLVGELHRPVEVVPHAEYPQHNREEEICHKANDEAHIVARKSPVETRYGVYLYGILAERGDAHTRKQERQHPEEER